MKNHRLTLEPYKGRNNRFLCPNCQSKEKSFTRYIDTETGEYIAPDVGRCNHQINCGYHYTPKQYFEDNNINTKSKSYVIRPRTFARSKPKNKSFINGLVFKKSLKGYEKNNFVKFLINRFGKEIATKAIERYFIGTSKLWDGATIFWLIDIKGNVCTGKIMLFNSKNCKRIKDKNNWAHSLLKIEKHELCFYGEHLLNDKSKVVIVVESEKTAIIGSIYFPDFIWLANSGGEGLNARKCEVLKGRTVVLFPDLSKPKEGKPTYFEKWSIKAKEFGFKVSDLLERKATLEQQIEGLDIADYLLQYEIKDFELKLNALVSNESKPLQEHEFSEGSLEVHRIVQERKNKRIELTKEESYKSLNS